jgi:hypothetical protein
MSREYFIDTPTGPVLISETGSRTENINGVFVTESISAATGTWKTTNGLLSASTKTVNGLSKASIKTFGGITP